MKPRSDERNNLMSFLAANRKVEAVAEEMDSAPQAEPLTAVLPALPPVQERLMTARATFVFPATLLDRLDALQRRWKGERRRVTKDQMMTTALEEYLRRYENL